MLSRWAITLALTAACWLATMPGARADLPGVGNPDNWRLTEVTWRDMGGVPLDSQFNYGLTAHYNMGYGATVLGVTTRVADDNRYYAVVASLADSQLTTLDYLGPCDAAPRWDSGPYHIAAGLPDGRLVLWLTAPNEYPVAITVSWNYIPDTAFCCQVYPSDPPSNRWADWTATIAYQAYPEDPGVEVVTIDGLCRVITALDWFAVTSPLKQLALREYSIGNYILPGLLYSSRTNIYSRWFHPTQGWRRDKLATGINQTRIWLSPTGRQPGALALYNDAADIYEEPLLHQLSISTIGDTGITVRWGDSVHLGEEYQLDLTAFIDSAQLRWPLIVQSTGADVYLAWHDPAPRAGLENLQFTSSLLQMGERGISGNSEVALHPIQSIAGTAHWRTGMPEILWVQLGGGQLLGEGALFSLKYVEPK